ncbi:DUF6912 family protein [Aquipuribacter sp. SD81]|uniref:DUF6912 family protein n=1 Tax=Aquipuribacter sp. SD81 TaxID=3127703 RepID=UPI003019112A
MSGGPVGGGGRPQPVRVYVPTTWDALPALRAAGGLRAGAEGYAATDALADALGLPHPAAAGEDALDDLHDAAAAAAADASLLLLAATDGTDDTDGPDGPGGAAPRRAVLAVDVPVTTGLDAQADGPGASAEGPAHPAAVRLAADVPWARVAAVLADDAADEPSVRDALRLAVEGDEEAALARLEDLALGWYAPSEVPDADGWPPSPTTS